MHRDPDCIDDQVATLAVGLRSIQVLTIRRFTRVTLLVSLVVLLPLTISMPAGAEDTLASEIETLAAAAGEVLAIDDLCQWGLTPKVEKTIQDWVKKTGMSERKMPIIRERVTEARTSTFGNLSPAGRIRMKADICNPAERDYLERMISQISFD
jgi:hypothetical protein